MTDEGTKKEEITKALPITLEGDGLNPGEWDFVIDRLIGDGSAIYGGKDIIIRILLNKKETWKNILKAIPKGSMIKNYRRVR